MRSGRPAWLVAAALLGLGGCADVDKSFGQHPTSQSATLCSPLPAAEVEARLSAAWMACYDKSVGGHMMPAGGVLLQTAVVRPFRLERQADRQGGVSLALVEQYRHDQTPRHHLHAELGSSASCATSVRVRAYNEPYLRGVARTEEWLAQPPGSARPRCD
ncbi:hypothetical protein KAK06_14315 [Ideonella sp. 4Y11]|uniref:Lipoprotein n=1 Tax=Ideonella aquatica TaxID=2824119 RepID=A0A940YHC3_9BURK|nr:hypothetical protein [Ideonella aquatica]MBQ0960125.1 hypothetical protein [Ideonella aquatica]